MTEHFKKMLTFLRLNILGRKQDILSEVDSYVAGLSDTMRETTKTLGKMGVNLIGDLGNHVKSGLEGDFGSVMRPVDVQTSRFGNLISLPNHDETGANAALSDLPRNSDRILDIFREFGSQMNQVFTSNKTSIPYRRYVYVEMQAIKA